MSAETSTRCKEMIALLDEAVQIEDECSRCHRIKDVLHDIVSSQEDFVPVSYLKPCDVKYARRLLHKDPAGRYSVVIMVWGPGQGTPIHDHAGCWCVECVYRGRINVVSYDLIACEGDRFDFKQEQEIVAGIGDAGALIPPFEYHTIKNAESTPSTTIHVYAGELEWCHIFEQDGDHYRRAYRELCYTQD